MTDESITPDVARRHMRVGWWSLLIFAAVGLLLESFHALKLREYLDVSNETRRLMWTLAHAHGTLLAVVNIIFGLTIRVVPEMTAPRQRQISLLLRLATPLIPAGFFLGGTGAYGGDPGVGIVLLPIGAACLLLAVIGTARSTMSVPPTSGATPRSGRRGRP